MKKIIAPWGILITIIAFGGVGWAGGEKGSLGVGFRSGLTQFESDLVKPILSPFFYGHLKFYPSPFLSLGGEFGYAKLRNNDPPSYDLREGKEIAWRNIQTEIMPFELDLTFNFLPLGKVNPYVVIGGGGVYWDAKENGTVREIDNKRQEGIDSFLKTGGGFEFILNKKVTFSLGGTFRYSFTDWLDQKQRPEDDKTDQLLDFYAGLTYYFKLSTKGDKDSDGVPDELDLAPEVAEDPDGYLDHDGKPDGFPEEQFAGVLDIVPDTSGNADDTIPPVVIHIPIRVIEEGRRISINTEVLENKQVKVVSVLYRRKGVENWKVLRLKNLGGSLYTGDIPGEAVKPPALQYCVVAVDEAVSGIGYSGLPKLPNEVKVLAKPTQWRVVAGTVAILGWGGASYLIYNKK